LQKAVAEILLLPQEDLTAISNFLQASEVVTRKQFRLLTNPMLRRHRLVYAFEWLPIVRDPDRSAYEGEARGAGLTDYRVWGMGHRRGSRAPRPGGGRPCRSTSWSLRARSRSASTWRPSRCAGRPRRRRAIPAPSRRPRRFSCSRRPASRARSPSWASTPPFT